jgi:DNA-binding MarR family transcriptional regulator
LFVTRDLPPLPVGSPRTRRHRVANALNSTSIHALRAARIDDSRTGLTPERLSLLSVLVYAGPTTMSALARAEQLSPPAITRTVTALEEAGLVRRRESPDDRRQTIVSATAAGTRLLEHGRRARIERLADLLDTLDGPDLDRVSEALALVRRALREDHRSARGSDGERGA